MANRGDQLYEDYMERVQAQARLAKVLWHSYPLGCQDLDWVDCGGECTMEPVLSCNHLSAVPVSKRLIDTENITAITTGRRASALFG